MTNEDLEVRWHVNDDSNDFVMRGLAALMRLGFAEEKNVQQDELAYMRQVCAKLALTIASMPATQRAMGLSHPGFSPKERFAEVVRGIAKTFRLDGDAILSTIQLGPSRPQPGMPEPDLPSMPPGPVN